MEFEIEFSSQAENDLREILSSNADRYSPTERLNYAVQLRDHCLTLSMFPNRGTSFLFREMTFRRLNFKAHSAYFRVFEEQGMVRIETILHSSMDPKRHLTG